MVYGHFNHPVLYDKADFHEEDGDMTERGKTVLNLDKEKAEFDARQAKKCRYYNGILAGKCLAGIKYPKFDFPCFGEGDCEKYEPVKK